MNIVDKAGKVRMVLGCTEPSGGAAIVILSQSGHPVIVLGTFPDSEQVGKEAVAIHMESGEEDIGATLSLSLLGSVPHLSMWGGGDRSVDFSIENGELHVVVSKEQQALTDVQASGVQVGRSPIVTDDRGVSIYDQSGRRIVRIDFGEIAAASPKSSDGSH